MTDNQEVHVHLHVDTESEERGEGLQSSIGSGVLNAEEGTNEEEGLNAGAARLSAQDLEEGFGVDSTLTESVSADAPTAQNAGSAPTEVRRTADRGRSDSPGPMNEVRLKDLTRRSVRSSRSQ